MNIQKMTVTVLCMALCFSNVVYAAEDYTATVEEEKVENVDLILTNSEQKKVCLEQKEVVEQLENVDFLNASEKEIDQNVKEVLEESYETMPELVQEARETEGMDEEYICVEDNMPVKTYAVNEGVEIIFDGSLTTVSILEESEERDSNEDFDEEESIISKVLNFGTLQVKVAGKSKVKNASNTEHIYETVHYKKDGGKSRTIKVATAYIGAEFTYNKSAKTCTAVRTGNYLKANGLSNLVVNVHSKKAQFRSQVKAGGSHIRKVMLNMELL